jgi:hypothetical protein
VKKKTKAVAGELTRAGRLRSEIAAALEGIEEEGLVFLLDQANTLLHNARVEELERKRKSRKGSEDEAAEPAAPRTPAVAVEESKDRKAFFVTLGNERKVLSLPEMQQVVRICHDAPSAAEAATRLYTVFSRERRDILADAGIGSARHPLLAALVDAVKARYRPRGA